VGDQLANLVPGDAIAEGAFEVAAQLPLALERNKVATVIRLRSRFEKPGRSQTSPLTTVSAS
jgi:hypothetical protein